TWSDWLPDPYGRHHAVADRHDARHVPLVGADEPVVLADRGGGAGQAVAVLARGGVSAPDHVVAQPQTADPDALGRGPPAVRVPRLVHVAVDDVEFAVLGGDPLQRVAHPVAHARPQPGPGEVVLGALRVA